MPSLQVVNTDPGETPNRAEENLKKFFSKLGKDYQDKQDRVEIDSILSNYEKNIEDKNAFEKLNLDLERSNVSPSRRLQARDTIKQIGDRIEQKDKALNEKVKAMEAEAKEKRAADEKIAKDKRIADEKLDKERKAQQESLDKSAKTAAEVNEILLNGGEDPEEAARLSTILTPASANARVRESGIQKKAIDKETKEAKEVADSKKITQNSFNEIAKLIPKAGVGTETLSFFGGENARTLGKFKALTGALEANLVEQVNKGTLSDTRFKYITQELLPSPTDTQEKIKGKMEGLAIMLDLDPSELQNLDKKPSKKKQKTEEKKVEEPKAPQGKVRVKIKGSNPPVYGSVTPYPGMEAKYDVITK